MKIILENDPDERFGEFSSKLEKLKSKLNNCKQFEVEICSFNSEILEQLKLMKKDFNKKYNAYTFKLGANFKKKDLERLKDAIYKRYCCDFLKDK